MKQLTSYAQNFEDVMLWRALGDVERGCYVDVGAQSPDVDSVSRLFHERGWHGIHVEPVPEFADQLRSARPGDDVIQAAVAAEPGVLRFFEIAHTGLSTAHEDVAARHRESGFEVSEATVPAVTLDSVLASVGDREVHWMKIDVEGAEADVLAGWKSSAVLPWVVIIESTLPSTRQPSHHAWEPLLSAKGYRFAYFDGLNRFYVSPRHARLAAAFEAGPNIFDGFVLGEQSTSPFGAEFRARIAALESDLGSEIEELRRSLSSLERDHVAEVARLVTDLRANESAYRDEHERMASLLHEAERRRAKDIAAVHADFHAAIERYAEDLARVHAERAVVQERWARSQQDIADLRAEVEESHAQLKARTESERLWKGIAEQRSNELRAVYASTSWRLTSPLRSLKQMARASTGYVDPGRPPFPLRVRRTAGRGLAALMRTIVERPAFRTRAQALLGRLPRLRNKLRDFAVRARVIPGHAENHAEATAAVSAPSETVAAEAQAPALSRRGSEILRLMRTVAAQEDV